MRVKRGFARKKRKGKSTVQNERAALPVGSVSLGRFRSSISDLIAPNEQSGSWRLRLSRGGYRLALIVALVLAVLAVGLGTLRGLYNDRIYPQVSVAGMNVGGMSREEALQVLQTRGAQLEQNTITFTYNDQTWSPTLSELGVTIDYNATLNDAYGVGRESDAMDRFTSSVGLLRDSHRVPLSMTVDQNQLTSWFAGVTSDLGSPPHDASISVKNGKTVITPDVNGTVVDTSAAQAIILKAITSLQPVSAELPVRTFTASVHSADLAPAQASLDKALSKPVTITFGGNTWDLTPDVLGQFVVQTVDPNKTGADAVSVEFDIKALSKYLTATYASDINHDAVDAKVAWSTDSNELIATQASVDGTKIKPTTFAQAVATSFFGGHGAVDVPVTVQAPQIDSNNLSALGITTKIAVGDSNFDGSDEGRATNIGVGAGLLNGTLVPPHGEFSFNHSIGVIETDKGYVEAGVIDGERIGRDVGGGICQVSTTVFRAALLAGFPITEWWPHSYRLGFYEKDGWSAGFDASILQPDGNPFGGGDFKFVNPSDSWLLLESYTDYPNVFVMIYGPDLGYNVKISDPIIGDAIPPDDHDIENVNPDLAPGEMKQTEYAVPGYNVSFTRDVYDKDGNLLIEDTYDSPYASHPNVWQVAPDMQGKSPASQQQ